MNPINLILEKPLVPVFYHSDLAICKSVIQACYNGGVRVFEFTNRGANALDLFKELVPFVKDNCAGMILGIGTIYDAVTAKLFIDAGADFIVQPFTTPEVGAICQKHTIPWIPGAMTVTEIQNAHLLGAEIVKIFPGNVLGSAYIKALRGPIPQVKLMVTGGVEPTESSIKEWFGAGVNAVGLGSQLFKNMNEPQKITDTLKDIFQYV